MIMKIYYTLYLFIYYLSVSPSVSSLASLEPRLMRQRMLTQRRLQYSTVQYSTVQYSTVQYSTVPAGAHVEDAEAGGHHQEVESLGRHPEHAGGLERRHQLLPDTSHSIGTMYIMYLLSMIYIH